MNVLHLFVYSLRFKVNNANSDRNGTFSNGELFGEL